MKFVPGKQTISIKIKKNHLKELQERNYLTLTVLSHCHKMQFLIVKIVIIQRIEVSY